MTDLLGGKKDDSGKIPWSLIPLHGVEQIGRCLFYGRRKYTECGKCGGKIYPNPRLDGDPERNDCPHCKSTNILTGEHNWRKGFNWSQILNASYRHLFAIFKGEDIDPETGELHAAHLGCNALFLVEHKLFGYGKDDRYPFKEKK